MIDTTEAVSSMIDALSGLPSTPPSIFIDLEGVNLSRRGTISILQIHIRTTGQNYLVDVKTLEEAAFSTKGRSTSDTLTSILESASIPKVFFDVRNDSDALFCHYGIKLQGIQDIQLMEFATRTYPGSFICGLKKCIERDVAMGYTEKNNWMMAKQDGLKLFSPDKGGSYEVFNQRPLPETIKIYCIQDVNYLPRLWDLYDGKLAAGWRTRVEVATKDRVTESQTYDYDAQGPDKARPPKGW